MELESAAQKLELRFSKAESELTALSYKIDQEYSTLAAEEGKGSIVPSDLLCSVKNLRAELNQVSKDLCEVQKQQHEVMSTIQAQLKVYCGQFDELSKAAGDVALE
ncbi:uncharacterized protein TBC1d7 isoform X2 [Macrobrachium rosenbergii]|uniref:uncharacterized protein TBC1d7 isoform X2 n=1 Tax=Macrobrachium rosenbergii TaxID=79674 RepID=UPI0034D5EB08